MASGRKIRLIAAVRQNIGGRYVMAGEQFECEEGEAGDLVAINFASVAPREPEPTSPTPYLTRDMRADRERSRNRR